MLNRTKSATAYLEHTIFLCVTMACLECCGLASTSSGPVSPSHGGKSLSDSDHPKAQARRDLVLCPLLSLVSLVAAVSAVVVVELILKEYMKTAHFDVSRCQVTMVVRLDGQVCQNCQSESGCFTSSSPCSRLMVTYRDALGFLQSGLLHSSLEQLEHWPQVCHLVTRGDDTASLL